MHNQMAGFDSLPRLEADIGELVMIDDDTVRRLGLRLRIDSIRVAAAANSGHPTSSMSAADLMAVLMARHLRYDFDEPHLRSNDHLVFSKGHASPLLYSVFKAAGVVS